LKNHFGGEGHHFIEGRPLSSVVRTTASKVLLLVSYQATLIHCQTTQMTLLALAR